MLPNALQPIAGVPARLGDFFTLSPLVGAPPSPSPAVAELGSLGGYERFMKISCIIISALLLVGCASKPHSASLTAEQAKSAAMRLANDKASAFYHCQPFRDGKPAQFVAGHWVWVGRQGYGHGDFQATVELAADGSTNNVDLQLCDSQVPFTPTTRSF